VYSTERLNKLHDNFTQALCILGVGLSMVAVPLFLHCGVIAVEILRTVGLLLVWYGSMMALIEIGDILGTDAMIKLGGWVELPPCQHRPCNCRQYNYVAWIIPET
jgi:hypothetical protein